MTHLCFLFFLKTSTSIDKKNDYWLKTAYILANNHLLVTTTTTINKRSALTPSHLNAYEISDFSCHTACLLRCHPHLHLRLHSPYSHPLFPNKNQIQAIGCQNVKVSNSFHNHEIFVIFANLCMIYEEFTILSNSVQILL